jgi:sugar phosphate permease
MCRDPSASTSDTLKQRYVVAPKVELCEDNADALTPPEDRRDHSKRRAVVAVLALVYALSMVAFRPTIMLTLPAMLKDLELSQHDAGMLLSLCQVTYMVTKPAALALSDQIDARQLLLGSLWLSGLMCFLIAAATQRWHLMVTFAGLMAFQSPHMGATSKFLTRWFDASDRGSAFSLVISCSNLTSILVPYSVNAILGYNLGWEWVFYAAGVMTVLGAMAATAVVEDCECEDDDYTAKSAEKSSTAGTSMDMLHSGLIFGVGLSLSLVSL